LRGQLFNQLHPDWQLALGDLQTKVETIEKALQDFEVTPDFDNIFKALSKPISSTKVVIFGQDPYPGAGVAQGLAFSTFDNGGKIPASLRNIFVELKNDLGGPTRTVPDLSDWSNQGVLLLNRILTTAVGSSLSHSYLEWEKVTDQVAKKLGDCDVVAICWGKSAQQVSHLFRSQWLIESAHPSPLSAYRGFFGSKPFSKANQILVNHGIEPINW
jgi:uracil-DNA glycosylase